VRLDELRQIIIESADKDEYWHALPPGPYFTDAPDIDDDTFRQHSALYVFKDDLDLTIQEGLKWGHLSHDVERVDQLWDDVSFPDESAMVSNADVFWRGSLVDRVLVVTVDGGRATLPVGSRRALNYEDGHLTSGTKVQWEYTCTAYEAALARVVDQGQEFDRYLRQTGMVIRN